MECLWPLCFLPCVQVGFLLRQPGRIKSEVEAKAVEKEAQVCVCLCVPFTACSALVFLSVCLSWGATEAQHRCEEGVREYMRVVCLSRAHELRISTPTHICAAQYAQ